jgi:organic radical activating enzyme
MDEVSGNLVAIFCSYQGEGIYAGVKQIFLRLAGCNLRCDYCDTPESWEPERFYRAENPPLSREFKTYENPAGILDIKECISNYISTGHFHSISITGGEPLLQTEFLKIMLPVLRQFDLPVYLETNATMPENLGQILNLVDIIAVDVKLPSSLNGVVDWANSKRFLEIASQKEMFVKSVITQKTTEDEIKNTCQIIKELNIKTPFVLQPVTPAGRNVLPPDTNILSKLKKIAQRYNIETHIIPQIHKLAGWL